MSETQPDLFPLDRAALQTGLFAFLFALLEGPARPSAREVLKAAEREVSLRASEFFLGAVAALAYHPKLRAADRAYFRTMLDDGSAEVAVRGERVTDDEAVSTIDALLRQGALYRRSEAFREMIAFMGRFRDYAPYNVMLVRLQNPSCGFFATEKDWRDRHGRTLIEDALPMLILAPMHPVMLVYDVDQTTGKPLPKELEAFGRFDGPWNPRWLANMLENAERHRIRVEFKTLSSTHAGWAMTAPADARWKIRIVVHAGLDEPSRFGVLAHEMAHILLGHLGTDRDHWWPGRFNLHRGAAEVEAESVAHIVASRFGLTGSSAAYVAGYMGGETVPLGVSMDLIAKVAGKLEGMARGLQPAPEPRPLRKAKPGAKR